MSHLTRGLAAAVIGGAVLHIVLTLIMTQSDVDWSYASARPALAGWDAIAITVTFALLAVIALRSGAWSDRGLLAIGLPATGVAFVAPVIAIVFALDPNSDSRLNLFNATAWVLLVTVTIAALALIARGPWSAATRLTLLPACAVLPAGFLMTTMDDSTGWYVVQVLAAVAVALPAARALAVRPTA